MTSPEAAAGAPSARNGSAMRVRVRGDLEFETHAAGGRTGVICHDPARGSYFRLGAAEYRVARLLDGSRTIAEVVERTACDGDRWSEADVMRLAGTLVKAGLAEIDGAPGAGNAEAERAASDWTRAVAFRMPLIDADWIARGLERRVGAVFSMPALVAWAALVAIAVAAVAQRGAEWRAAFEQVFRPEAWPWLAAAWVGAKLLHEAGHAVCARCHGVAVGRAGIVLFLLAPVAYVDVTQAWQLRSRWARVQIALAGVYVELAAAALAGLLWWGLDDGLPRHLAFQVMLVAGPATLLVNANPLLRLDGYYALADLLEIPNLAMHGRRQLGGWVERALLGRRRAASLLDGWRAPAATVHAGLSVVYQAVWIAGLLVVVSRYWEGVGAALAVVAAAAWVVLPLVRWGRRLVVARDWPVCRRRLAASAAVIGCAVAGIALVPSPLGARIPVVARYHKAQRLRATTAGFVRRVHVRVGDAVRVGDPLVEIENQELELRRSELEGKVAAAAIRFRQFQRQGERARAQAEQTNRIAASMQLAEVNEQLAGLRAVAERDGIVLTARVAELLGSYVEPGQLLVTVGHPDEKELIGAVAEADWDAAEEAAKRGSAGRVRMRGGTDLRVSPGRPSPRAARTAPDRALEATAGGPLAVRAVAGDREELELLRSRFEIRARVAAADTHRVAAGMRGVLRLASGRSLGADLVAGLWRWIGGEEE